MKMADQSHRRHFLSGFAGLTLAACAPEPAKASERQWETSPYRRISDAEWRRRLGPESWTVLRHEGTERPFSSALNDEHRAGVFSCRGCGLALFRSEWKFDSHTGWPSFFRVIEANIGVKADYKIGVRRTEYHCARCLGHQGHLFMDGPLPTGRRYCNNGVALRFQPA